MTTPNGISDPLVSHPKPVMERYGFSVIMNDDGITLEPLEGQKLMPQEAEVLMMLVDILEELTQEED